MSENLKKTALLGTERYPLSDELRKAAEEYGIDIRREDAAVLLSLIAAETHFSRAAIVLPRVATPLPQPNIAANALLQPCSATAAAAIRAINEEAIRLKQPILFAEIIAVLAKNKQALPNDVLPDVLNNCYVFPELWIGLGRVLGGTGGWLSEQNPDWLYARPSLDEAVWQTGSKAERIDFLRILRVREPQRAHTLLHASWATESNELKLSFLKIIEKTMTETDETIALEAFQSPRKDVREFGQKLLDQLKKIKNERKVTFAEKVKGWLAPTPEKVWLEALQKTGFAIYSDSALLRKIETDPARMSPTVVSAILDKLPNWLQNAPTYSNKSLDTLLLQVAILAENPKSALADFQARAAIWNDNRYFFVVKAGNRAKRLLHYRAQLRE
ncbi:MAG: hypothetical protein RI894_2459 [Bacteroidota bacterium]|jgi:hypothetical protein